jgi:TolB protein
LYKAAPRETNNLSDVESEVGLAFVICAHLHCGYNPYERREHRKDKPMKRLSIILALLLLCISGQVSASCSNGELEYGDSCEERFRRNDDPHIYSFFGEEGDLVTITLTWDDDAEGTLLIAGPVIEDEDDFELQVDDINDDGEAVLEEIELPDAGVYGIVVIFDARVDYTLTLEGEAGDDDEEVETVDTSFLAGTTILLEIGAVPDNPSEGSTFSIFRATAEATEIVVDTDNESYSNNCGDISDDGEMIAFTSNRDFNGASTFSHSEIYSARADGSRQRRLTDTEADEVMPRWSPDGERIVFMASEEPDDPSTYEIFIMDADGDNLEQLTDNNDADRYPSWSPDGELIIFHSDSDGDYELYTMTPDGENLEQLTDNDWFDFRAMYSPDGEQIVFTTDEDGQYDLYLMDADGGNIEQLTDDNNDESAALWSPDGTMLAFYYSEGTDAPTEVWVINADGSDQRQLFADSDTYYAPCDWSILPD